MSAVKEHKRENFLLLIKFIKDKEDKNKIERKKEK